MNLLLQVGKARNDNQFNEVKSDPFSLVNKTLLKWRECQEATKNQEDEGDERIMNRSEYTKWEHPEKGA